MTRRAPAPSGAVLAAGLALLLLGGCAPDPQRGIAVELTRQLAGAREQLVRDPSAPGGPCDTAGEVRAKLYVEPGPRSDRLAWEALGEATDALITACGQLRLLRAPASADVLVSQTRAVWRDRAERSLAAMCGPLRQAGDRLNVAMDCPPAPGP